MNTDYLCDEDGDLLFGANGDFVSASSDQQHIADILVAVPGDYRQHPTLGVAAIKYKNKLTIEAPKFERDVKEQLKADGYTEIKVDVSGGFENIIIEAK